MQIGLFEVALGKQSERSPWRPRACISRLTHTDAVTGQERICERAKCVEEFMSHHHLEARELSLSPPAFYK